MNEDFITIVSGLPRSGTSMMMQILEARGMEILTDNVRRSNEDNPRGYYEYEPVKKTKSDPSWLKQAPGKAVKMVYKLLYNLPNGHEYRVIMMRRKIEQVLASQRIMLERNGKSNGDLSDERIGELLQRQMEQVAEWLAKQETFSAISVDYANVVEDPTEQCRRIDTFLGGGGDIEQMAVVVDSNLYRNRN